MAGAASGVVVGAFTCLALVFVGVAATIVLSLISTFTTNRSQQGYGEEYRCDTLMLKTLYTNVSYTFSNSTIADNPTLSSYCTSQLTNKSIGSFSGCLLQNGYGWGPYNTSTNSKRRRRATALAGLYSIHDGRLFFSNECPKKGDVGKSDNGSKLSSCVAQRLGYVNNLVNNYSGNFILWTPAPAFVLEVVSTDLGAYRTLIPSTIYGVPRGAAVTVATELNLNSNIISQLARGCRYLGGLSLSQINAILAAQSLETTTQPVSNPAGG
jgi:hypothetical protein